MTGPENWMISYPIFFTLMGLVGWFNWWILRKLDWI